MTLTEKISLLIILTGCCLFILFIENNFEIIDCRLLDRNYNGERSVTIFDCGIYGRIVTQDENIFRFAVEGQNKLKISFYGKTSYRILGVNNH